MTMSTTFQMRVHPAFIELIDEWRRDQPDLPSRAEAIRRLTLHSIQIQKEKKTEYLDKATKIIEKTLFKRGKFKKGE